MIENEIMFPTIVNILFQKLGNFLNNILNIESLSCEVREKRLFNFLNIKCCNFY